MLKFSRKLIDYQLDSHIVKHRVMYVCTPLIVLAFSMLLGCASDRPMHDNYDSNMQHIQTILDNAASENGADNLQEGAAELPPAIMAAMMPASFLTENEEKDTSNRFDMTVTNVDAKTFFSTLARENSDNFIISPNVTGTISLDLKHVTVPEILEFMRKIYGYGYKKNTYGYAIFPKEMESKLIAINHLALKRSGSAEVHVNSSTILGSSANKSESDVSDQSSSTVTTTSTDTFWDDLESTIKAIIKISADDEGTPTVSVNPNTGLIYIRAYPQELDKVLAYIGDTQAIIEREVLIEMQILDVTLSRQYASGIDWSVLTSSGSTTTADITSAKSGLLSNIYELSMSGDNGNFSYAVKLLSSQGKVSILSQPRVTATNNQDALIKFGQDEYFVTNTTTDVTTSTDGNTSSSSINLDPFFSGIMLEVKPEISEDNAVNLYVHPIITKTVDDNKTIIVDNETSDLPLAKTVFRETDTIIKAQSGQVIIVGGLMQTEVALAESGMPLLNTYGKGYENLLQAKSNLGEMHEIVILLKPTVIGSNKSWKSKIHQIAENDFNLSRNGNFLRSE